MDINSLRTGDLLAWAASIDADQRETFAIISPIEGDPDDMVTFLRVGRAAVLITPDGAGQVNVHEHDTVTDEECWTRNAAAMREAIAEANGRAMVIRRDPRAQQLLRSGMDPAMLDQLMRHENPFQV